MSIQQLPKYRDSRVWDNQYCGLLITVRCTQNWLTTLS